MSELFEPTTFQCGDGAALVTYLYGEASPTERNAIEAHVARCRVCTEELAALGATREHLTVWTPPTQALGFQISRDRGAEGASSAAEPATILRPGIWWTRPLPAWAQMAAAVLIFASGLAIGALRTSSATPSNAVAPAGVPSTAKAAEPGVNRTDLTQLEQRLRTEIAQLRTSAPAENTSANGGAVLQRVAQMIAASEARQQKELEFRTSVLANDFAAARRIDNANFEQRLRGTTVRVLSNQQDINSLAQRVGFMPNSAPYVP